MQWDNRILGNVDGEMHCNGTLDVERRSLKLRARVCLRHIATYRDAGGRYMKYRTFQEAR